LLPACADHIADPSSIQTFSRVQTAFDRRLEIEDIEK